MTQERIELPFNADNLTIHDAKACVDAVRALLIAIEQDCANPGGNRVDMAVTFIEEKFTAAS